MSSNDWVPTLVHTLFWAGNIAGCVVWGASNDWWVSILRITLHYFLVFSYGRRPTILMSHIVYFLGGVGTSVFPFVFSFISDDSTRGWLNGISLCFSRLIHYLTFFFYSDLFLRFLVGCAHHTVSHLPYLVGIVDYTDYTMFIVLNLCIVSC